MFGSIGIASEKVRKKEKRRSRGDSRLRSIPQKIAPTREGKTLISESDSRVIHTMCNAEPYDSKGKTQKLQSRNLVNFH